jgi:hypothetical protein
MCITKVVLTSDGSRITQQNRIFSSQLRNGLKQGDALSSLLFNFALEQWHSTFFVRVPLDIISFQLCTPQSCWCIIKVIHNL